MSEDNRLWHEMVSYAIEIQQQYYELLSDWTKYEMQDYDILKQNIGYALFGPPTESCQVDNVENKEIDSSSVVSYVLENAGQLTKVNEGVRYKKDAMKLISLIFDQIITYGKQSDESIFCGIIYNIIFNVPTKKKEVNNKENVDIDTEEIMKDIQAVPIFKIKNYCKTSSTENIEYIDNNGRVYEDWISYKTNNTLPDCVMVLPNGGLYQPNPEFEITEICSTVWVEVCYSPASSLSAKLVSGADTASTVLNVGGLGIALASLVTPIGPVVALAGIATTGVSSAWTFGRSIYQLYDRSSHRESLSDRNALSAWLGIAGCTMGIAMSGGSIFLSKAAQAGQDIGLVARTAYNATVICNMSINLVGLGYNGFNIVEKYQNENRIDWSDVFFFTTHAMFFGNTVLGMQFAHDVINTSRGNVMRDYEATLRSKRHRKAYNRIKRNATSDAEVVRYVRKVQTRTELLSSANSNKPNGSKSNASKPSSSQPSDSKSSGNKPNSSQPSGDQPNGSQPSNKQPSGKQSNGSQPSGKQPSGKQLNGSQPSDKQLSGKQPNDSQPSAKQPNGSQPSGKQPSGKQPNGSQPSDKQLSGKQPNDSQPSGKQPNGSQPSVKQSNGNQPSGSQFSVSGMTRIKNDLSFSGGKVKIGNMIILDPLLFMRNFKESSHLGNAALLATSSASFTELSVKLFRLLTNYYNDYPLIKNISTVSEFESILCEIQYMENSTDILDKVFIIAIKLAVRSFEMDPHLEKIVRFVWEYGKVHLIEKGLDAYAFIINNSINKMLSNIIKTVYDEIDLLIDRLLIVLHSYLSENNKLMN
ncbi:uncharacterized protein LOC122518442 [Polistes fuscatus]|uniref:uncharacterized protein LOC122518442 n=1 Tax=Polistes fuscatus TaxID=30207 RepID=UPI001CA866BB|nr:uncharacterized protein LOC122518442 [Polistes fuscatus]